MPTEPLFTLEPGADLPDNGPGDDRVDVALQDRAQAYESLDALQWLLDGQQQQPGTGQPSEQETPLAAAARPSGADAEGRGLGETALAVGRDIAMGAVETPRQIVGGLRDAAQSLLDFTDWVDEWAQSSGANIGGVQIFDDEGNFAPRVVSGEELAQTRAAGKETGVQLPDVGGPSTVTGSGVRAIAQFLGGFGVAGKAIGGIRGATAAGTAARSAGAGGLADFFGFGPHEERLSDLVQAVPELQNPVSEYLAADPNDSEIEGRLKNAIEGLGVGMVAEGLFRGIRAYRDMRRASRETRQGERLATDMRLAEGEQVLREAMDLDLLGSTDESVPLVTRASEKIKAALAETEAGVPDDVTARALTPKGLTPLAGESDVFINFARINAPEDIQQIIKDTADAMSGDVDKARRGVRTNVETVLSADKIDAWETLIARRTGEPLNAEQSVAARQLWVTAADKLGQVAEAAASNPTPENLFQFRRMFATYHAIQKEVIAARSETARALQSWAIPVGGNLEKMRDMINALDRTGGAETAEFLARRVAQLAKMDSGAQALSKFADKSVSARSLGTIQEYWINSLLSGPKTHMVNMMSNAGVIGVAALERAAAARIGRAFLDETGVEIGEAMAMLSGIRGAMLDAFRYAAKAFRTGQTGFGMNKVEMPRQRYISSGTWNVRSDSWLGRAIDGIGAIVNVPGRMLQAEDEFFKTIGYRGELHAQAARMAARELREGRIDKGDYARRVSEILDDPPEAIRMEAAATAAYQTFTNEPGKFVKGVIGLVGKYPTLKFVLPFINTPANILKYTFERTPLAPLTAKYRQAMARGGAEADLALTRMALGSLGLMYSIDLGLNGVTTGSGPADSMAEMQNWRRQGNQPYSVRIGDKFIAYNRLDPIGYHLGIGADIAEYLLNVQPDDQTAAEVEEAFAASVFAVAENITSKSYMQGLSLLMEALSEPDRFGPAYLERFASSFVPTGVAEVARFNDPVMRQSHDIVTAMKRRLPGYSSDLPPRLDLWGREIRYESGFGRGYDAVSPLYGSTYKPEPIDKLMEEDGWFIGMGGYGFSIDGENVSLRNMPDVKARFYQLRGSTKPSAMEADGLLDKYGDFTLLETLNGIVTGDHWMSERFQELDTPEDREDFVKRIVRDYYNAAKDRLFQEYPEVLDIARRKKEARQQ